MGVFAATITRSHLHGRLVDSMDAAKAAGVVDDWKRAYCALYLTNGRNQCVRHFLDNETDDVMLFVDSDIAFSPEAAAMVTKAVSEDEPVCSGWYRGLLNDGTTVPVVYDGQGEEFFQLTEDQLLARETDGEDPIVAVGATGAGFLALHRSLLVEMRGTWDAPCEWFTQPVMGGQVIGEDLGFCARIAHMGYPVLCHRDAKVTHFKETAF